MVHSQHLQSDREGDRDRPQRDPDRHQADQQGAAEDPVTPVEVGGTKYVVSARGETQWVKNVRADPNVKLGTTDYVAREILEQDRLPILTAYRERAGRAVEGYFRKLPREADHPVFVVTPKG
jgi:hypothetical protein